MTDPVDPERWAAIERVLDAALDLSADARSAFLDEACGSDAALRAEVESLLSAHDQADDYLEQPVASVSDALGSPYRVGQQVGPYRLVREIGRGGLGVVYLATDTALGRNVALKLLPAWRTTDDEARARFRREAMAAAALDHPGVCTVYEIGESEAGVPHIAMAYVEGESLKEVIARGPVALARAVDIGVQVASALAHAHDHGIVHRDVKPANIMVAHSGRVRLVDFGIAKLKDAYETRSTDDQSTGTASMKGAWGALTREGATPGTAAYMSPEQLLGRPVDHRSDIWATGVVLHEMVAGRHPFGGEDAQDRAHGILFDDPLPLRSVRSDVPLAVDRIVARALAKDPAQRYQHVDELREDLETALVPAPDAMPGSTRGPGAVGRMKRTGLVLGVALIATVVAALVVLLGPKPDPGSPLYLTILLPPGQELATERFRRFAVSPDGRQVVYVAGTGDGRRLYHRSLDSARPPQPILGTEDGVDPFFSPDGRWVGFFAAEQLRKVPLGGGAPEQITNAPTETSRGAAWGADGVIVLPLGQTSGLFRVSEDGGAPEPVTVADDERGRTAHFFPQILPGGTTVLFTTWRPEEGALGTATLDLATGEWEEIATGCIGARYVPTNHIVCAGVEGVILTDSFLVAPFTPGQHALGGPFAPVPAKGFHGYDFALSSAGTLVYGVDTSPLRRVTWVDREGRRAPVADRFDRVSGFALSPDGSRVAIARLAEGGGLELWLHDLAAGTSTHLSSRAPIDNHPLWSRDGTRLFFNSLRRPAGIYQVRPDRGDTATLLLERRGSIIVPGAVSADDRFLLYTELHPRSHGDIWVFSLADDSDRPLIVTSNDEGAPALSADDRWLAYSSDESGRDEIYVRPFPGPGAAIRVSVGGGGEPLWSADGTELFFRRNDTLMAVPVQTDPVFSAGPAVPLFAGPFAGPYIGARNYDVGSDGRFLMVHEEPTASQDRLEVVHNWFGELDRLAPGTS